jgi:hypothetical protein
MAPKQDSLNSSLRKRAQALLDGQYDHEAIERANAANSERCKGLDADLTAALVTVMRRIEADRPRGM